MKKTISLLTILLLVKNIHAQKSVGIRTGINSHQLDNKNINKFNQAIKEIFFVEIGLNHYTAQINLQDTKNTPNTVYQRFDIKRNNIDFYALVSYRLYYTKKFSLFCGLGPGLHYSRSTIDYSVIINKKKQEKDYSINDIYAPNGVLAITANYKLSNKLTVSTQMNTILYIPNKEYSANANLGIGYSF